MNIQIKKRKSPPPFSLFPELRFAIDNGLTLCKECHQKTDTWGKRLNKFKFVGISDGKQKMVV